MKQKQQILTHLVFIFIDLKGRTEILHRCWFPPHFLLLAWLRSCCRSSGSESAGGGYLAHDRADHMEATPLTRAHKLQPLLTTCSSPRLTFRLPDIWGDLRRTSAMSKGQLQCLLWLLRTKCGTPAAAWASQVCPTETSLAPSPPPSSSP